MRRAGDDVPVTQNSNFFYLPSPSVKPLFGLTNAFSLCCPLDYIDSLSLRRNVQQALNRSESYYKLHKAVSYANFGNLRFKTEDE